MRIRRKLISILEKVEPRIQLQGSWKYGDFHYDPILQTSYSDLDLVLHGSKKSDRETLSDRLRTALSGPLKGVRISIHAEDTLERMSFSVAQRILIPEYLLQRVMCERRFSAAPRDYVTAKFALLSLRKSTRERYADIKHRVGVELVAQLLGIKTGTNFNCSLNREEIAILCPNRFADALRASTVTFEQIDAELIQLQHSIPVDLFLNLVAKRDSVFEVFPRN